MVGGERRKNDPVQILHPGVLDADLQRLPIQPDRQESGLPQRSFEWPSVQRQRHLLRRFRRRHGKLAARSHERLNFRSIEGPVVDPHFIQFATKVFDVGNTSDMEIGLGAVQIRRANLTPRDGVAIHVEQRFAGSAANNRCDMLPSIGPNDGWRGRHTPVASSSGPSVEIRRAPLVPAISRRQPGIWS